MNNEAIKSYFVYKKYIKNEIKLRYKIITNNMKMLDYLYETVNSQSYKTYPEIGKEIDRPVSYTHLTLPTIYSV